MPIYVWAPSFMVKLISHFCFTHFQSMFHFYTPRKHQKTYKMVKYPQTILSTKADKLLSVFDYFVGFLMFSGGIEVEHWLKIQLN